MKDLIEFIGRGLREYLPLLVRIVAHPRSNIFTLVTRPEPINQAMTFFAITLAIILLLHAPWLFDGEDVVTKIGVLTAYKLIETALFALACLMIFRLLRGGAGYEPTLAAIFYIFSPPFLLLVLCNLFMTGLIAGVHPDLAESHLRTGGLSQGSFDAIAEIDLGAGAMIFFAALVSVALVFIWLAICWRVFARLNGFGRWRTVASFALCLTAMFLVSEACLIMLNGVYPKGLGVVL